MLNVLLLYLFSPIYSSITCPFSSIYFSNQSTFCNSFNLLSSFLPLSEYLFLLINTFHISFSHFNFLTFLFAIQIIFPYYINTCKTTITFFRLSSPINGHLHTLFLSPGLTHPSHLLTFPFKRHYFHPTEVKFRPPPTHQPPHYRQSDFLFVYSFSFFRVSKLPYHPYQPTFNPCAPSNLPDTESS